MNRSTGTIGAEAQPAREKDDIPCYIENLKGREIMIADRVLLPDWRTTK